MEFYIVLEFLKIISWEKYCPGDLNGQEINKNSSSTVSFPKID
jgi:hypothetical protein